MANRPGTSSVKRVVIGADLGPSVPASRPLRGKVGDLGINVFSYLAGGGWSSTLRHKTRLSLSTWA